MNARTHAAEKLVLRRASQRARRYSLLHRLARADEALLPLFPEAVANELAMVGFSIVFSGALVFLATAHLVLMQRLVENPFLLWIVAIIGGALFFATYLAIAHFVIGLARLSRRIRQVSLIGALLLSLVFSFVCAESFKQRLFANEFATELENIRLERQTGVVPPARGEGAAMDRNAREANDRELAWQRVNQRFAAEAKVASLLLIAFCFFVAWAPFFVLQSLRSSDYGCLFETIEETNRLAARGVGSGQEPG